MPLALFTSTNCLSPASFPMADHDAYHPTDIGNARIAGMDEDLQSTPPKEDWYEWALTAFYIAYICFEWMSILWRLIPAHIYVSVIVLSWGLTASLQAVAVNYPMLIFLRTMLGIGEAAFTGVPFYLSFFYKRHELALRTAIFISGKYPIHKPQSFSIFIDSATRSCPPSDLLRLLPRLGHPKTRFHLPHPALATPFLDRGISLRHRRCLSLAHHPGFTTNSFLPHPSRKESRCSSSPPRSPLLSKTPRPPRPQNARHPHNPPLPRRLANLPNLLPNQPLLFLPPRLPTHNPNTNGPHALNVANPFRPALPLLLCNSPSNRLFIRHVPLPLLSINLPRPPLCLRLLSTSPFRVPRLAAR